MTARQPTPTFNGLKQLFCLRKATSSVSVWNSSKDWGLHSAVISLTILSHIWCLGWEDSNSGSWNGWGSPASLASSVYFLHRMSSTWWLQGSQISVHASSRLPSCVSQERETGWSCIAFYDLALEVWQRHFCRSLRPAQDSREGHIDRPPPPTSWCHIVRRRCGKVYIGMAIFGEYNLTQACRMMHTRTVSVSCYDKEWEVSCE